MISENALAAGRAKDEWRAVAGNDPDVTFLSSGVFVFAGFGFAAAPETVKELINAKYNWGVRDNFLQELGKVTLKLELEFNKNAGFTANDDRIPEWMRRVSLPPYNGVFDVPDTDLDELFNW